MKYVKCNDCPCLNSDYEAPSCCNLGYGTDLHWFDKDGNEVADTPEMRSHQKDFDLFNVASNCGLIKIEYNNGVFKPEFVRKESNG